MEEEDEKREYKRKTIKIVLMLAITIALIVIGLLASSKYLREKRRELQRDNQLTTNNSNVACEDSNVVLKQNLNEEDNPLQQLSLKPIIYLYPEEKTEVSIKVGKPENLTTTYPKYTDGWNVVAKPDGTLIDTTTGRSLYALYWEGKRDTKKELTKGFVVKGEDTARFLEEKLAILGLNEREAEEFIVYWLPQLEKNAYNWIYFETQEEIEKNMPLEISPKPDTCIRIMMDWKGLEQKIDIPEQTLERQERSGYTAVEWGGTEIQ